MSAQLNEHDLGPDGSRSILQLLRDFTRETTALLRDEVDLAKTEVSEKIGRLGSGLVYLGAGALVAFAGLLLLLDAAVVALLGAFPELPVWAGPLIVGGIVLLVGAIMLSSGRSRLEVRDMAPQAAISEMRRDREMVREKLS
jgi:hypothetical protein